MSLSLHRFLPTSGDSRDVVGFGPVQACRPATLNYLAQVARAAEHVGQQRMTALHNGRRSDLVVAPNLWAGFGLVRGGAGTALVGSHDEVAERIAEYHAARFDHPFQPPRPPPLMVKGFALRRSALSGQPHLEGAWWFGEGVIPQLRHAGLLAAPTPTGDPQWSPQPSPR